MVETDRRALRAAAFLDGRERFWTSERIVEIDLAAASISPKAARFVFHVGFCGSTLIARLIDRPGSVLALKEPQCLVDIAAQQAGIERAHGPTPPLAFAAYALKNLQCAVAFREQLVIKPSNWVNNLVVALCASPLISRAVFISMCRRSFLVALFRGGRERLAFAARLAAHMAIGHDASSAILEQAIGGATEPLDRMARIGAVLHALQEATFHQAIAARGWGAECWVDFEEITLTPRAAIERVRSALDLRGDVAGEDLSNRTAEHSKNVGERFSLERRALVDSEVERHHHERFDAALDWLERAWPEPDKPRSFSGGATR